MFDKIKNAITGATDNKDVGDVNLGGYEQYLRGVTWPASKDEVLQALQENGADEGLKDHVQSLAGDRFDGPQDIFKSILNR